LVGKEGTTVKAEIIKVSKNYRPLTLDAVVPEIEKQFPEFECIPYGKNGDALIVKKSSFAGARIDVAEKHISIRGKTPEPLAKCLDVALCGTLSAATVPRVVDRLKRFLRDRYAS
jgi:hypothetical protein